MKKLAFGLLIFLGCATFASAQEHGEFGVFADYFRLNQTSTNFWGAGGRLSLGSRYLKLEAEGAYDFSQSFNENFTLNGSTTGGSVGFARSNMRIVNGLIGPVISTGHGPFRFFLTAKGGAVGFLVSNRPVNFSGFTSDISNLRSSSVAAAFYPGGGVEGHLGPIGLRLDVGDEMYFSGGTHHNLRVTFGPVLRF
ncbi:MAG TPA: hypothetical protein VJP87_08485 [Candidatus Acidoferrales bacterium]|nr:hypothetical protein [Candidatus Acidoferrales bacterium]